jgi:hypothetical protein
MPRWCVSMQLTKWLWLHADPGAFPCAILPQRSADPTRGSNEQKRENQLGCGGSHCRSHPGTRSNQDAREHKGENQLGCGEQRADPPEKIFSLDKQLVGVVITSDPPLGRQVGRRGRGPLSRRGERDDRHCSLKAGPVQWPQRRVPWRARGEHSWLECGGSSDAVVPGHVRRWRGHASTTARLESTSPGLGRDPPDC